MSKRISLLGSTGSIGRQTLDVIDACGMEVAAITANSSVDRLEEQARRYHPELAVLMDEKAAADLKVRLADTSVKVLAGMDGLMEAAALLDSDAYRAARIPFARTHDAAFCADYGGEHTVDISAIFVDIFFQLLFLHF